jgi:hypothetical protein
MDPTQRDYDTYLRLLDLWSKENPIKTTKLQVLLAVNGALISVVHYNGGFVASNLPLFVAGAVLSLVWTLSIGRTVLFQKAWQHKMQTIADRYPDDPRFQILDTRDAERAAPDWLRVLGGVSSKYYLMASPVVFSLAWLVGLLYALGRPG